MKQLIIILTLTFAYQAITACSCGEYLIDLPIKEMGWTQSKSDRISSFSDIIFAGKLIQKAEILEEELLYQNQKSQRQRIEMKFELIKSYKGRLSDTILIRTNKGSDACGFSAKLESECLIFANQNGNGFYYTYRSDCCKSISKNREEKRYNKYINFLESITNMNDGKYDFKQTRGYWNYGGRNNEESLDLIEYEIKDGKFEGLWKITDRKGRVIEKGQYADGLKIGTWEVLSIYESNCDGICTEKEMITYENGEATKSEITILDKKYDYGLMKEKIVAKQTILKTYENE